MCVCVCVCKECMCVCKECMCVYILIYTYIYINIYIYNIYIYIYIYIYNIYIYVCTHALHPCLSISLSLSLFQSNHNLWFFNLSSQIMAHIHTIVFHFWGNNFFFKSFDFIDEQFCYFSDPRSNDEWHWLYGKIFPNFFYFAFLCVLKYF